MTTDGHPSFRPIRLSPRPLYSALILAWVLILVVVVVFLVMFGVERTRVEFEQHAGQIHGEVTARLQFTDLALNGFAAFLSVTNRDERDAVVHYASAILQQTPHIHSLGVVEMVKESQVGLFLQEMRRAGYQDIAIRDLETNAPTHWKPAPSRPIYYPVSLLVTGDNDAGREDLVGLDIGEVDVFANTLRQALRTSRTHATGLFNLDGSGRGYALFRRIDAAASNGNGRSTSCLAMLFVHANDLIPASTLTEEYDYHISLVAQREQDAVPVTILDIPSQTDDVLAALFLPKLHYSRYIATSTPPMTFSIERRLTWKEINFPIIAWVMFAATLTLLLLHVYMTAHRHSEARRMELEDLLRYKAHHDELTGLPNRALIMDRIEQGIRDAHRDKQPMAVLFLDLNGFKPVNDTYGHEAGDHVLREVSQRLRMVVRDRDTVGRISGDEFIMILADTDRPGCDVVIEKIRHGFDAPFVIDAETNLTMGVSIGVAIYPDDGATPSDLMRIADNDMYRHKPRRF